MGMPLGARHTGIPFAVPQVYPPGQPGLHAVALPPAPPEPEVLVALEVEVAPAAPPWPPAPPPAPLLTVAVP
jgi:hypothetical protein